MTFIFTSKWFRSSSVKLVLFFVLSALFFHCHSNINNDIAPTTFFTGRSFTSVVTGFDWFQDVLVCPSFFVCTAVFSRCALTSAAEVINIFIFGYNMYLTSLCCQGFVELDFCFICDIFRRFSFICRRKFVLRQRWKT